MHNNKTYNNNHNYYTLTKSIKNIFNYQYTIPTHQNHNTKQIYIPILIKKHKQKKDLNHNKIITFSNYFFNTTQNHNQINNYTIHNIYIKKTFNTNIHYNFKNNFNLKKLKHNIKKINPNNIPYIITTITNNSTNNQPISLTNLKTIYNITKKYNIPIIINSTHFTKNTYFIKQHKTKYKN